MSADVRNCGGRVIGPCPGGASRAAAGAGPATARRGVPFNGPEELLSLGRVGRRRVERVLGRQAVYVGGNLRERASHLVLSVNSGACSPRAPVSSAGVSTTLLARRSLAHRFSFPKRFPLRHLLLVALLVVTETA